MPIICAEDPSPALSTHQSSHNHLQVQEDPVHSSDVFRLTYTDGTHAYIHTPIKEENKVKTRFPVRYKNIVLALIITLASIQYFSKLNPNLDNFSLSETLV